MFPRNIKDKVIEHPGRYRLQLVSGTTDTYDFIPVTGEVIESGTPINKGFLQPSDDAIADMYDGDTVQYDWVGGLPQQERHYDSQGRLIKQIDYTWVNGLPNLEVRTLKTYDDAGNLVDTKTQTKNYTWVNGLPTEVVKT